MPLADLEKLAADNGLTAGEIALVDEIGVREFELGRQWNFYEAAFSEDLELHRPTQIPEPGSFGNVYFLFWKVDEQEAYVPELAEVENDVIDAWKRREALPIAKARAQELAAEVKESGTSIEEFAASNELEMTATQTNEFTWMSAGFTPSGMRPPALSYVDGVESPGNEFMEAVFAMNAGDVGVAVNQPQTHVYVVRLISETPSEEELSEQFLQTGTSFDILQLASQDGQQQVRRWFEQREEQWDLVWHRPPEIR
jgi:hypothetical protein